MCMLCCQAKCKHVFLLTDRLYLDWWIHGCHHNNSAVWVKISESFNVRKWEISFPCANGIWKRSSAGRKMHLEMLLTDLKRKCWALQRGFELHIPALFHSQVAEVLLMDMISHFSTTVLIVIHLWSRQLLTCLCDKPFSPAPSLVVCCITQNVEDKYVLVEITAFFHQILDLN